MISPKSLTATVYVKFHYREPESKPVGEGETEMVARILDHTADMPRDLQEIVVKFAEYLNEERLKQQGNRRAGH